MKKHFRFDKLFRLHWVILLAPVLIFSCNRIKNTGMQNEGATKENASNDIYYCPMHPEVQQNHPGTCPKPECDGMELVKKPSTDILKNVLRPVNASVISTIKTTHAEIKSFKKVMEAQGYIDYDYRTKHTISARSSGRIEKLYIRYNFQPIAKGERIFDIYSPELITAQENLVYLLNTDAHEINLISAAEEKLKLLGFNDNQIKELREKKKVQTIVPVYSTGDGHIHEFMNANETAALKEDGANKLLYSTELQIKEGRYVTAGEPIFNIEDPHRVVIILQIKAPDIRYIKLNQEVEYHVDENQDMIMKGKVNFIEPFLNPGAKSINIRVDLSNTEHLHKVGSLVFAVINAGTMEATSVPAKSVIDLGRDKMVWLKKKGYFMAQKVETGTRSNGWIEIIEGIDKDDEIAEDAFYLNDSESFIKFSEDE